MAGVKIKRAKGGDRETTGSPIMRNCGCDFETELTVWHAVKCPPVLAHGVLPGGGHGFEGCRCRKGCARSGPGKQAGRAPRTLTAVLNLQPRGF